MKSIIFAGTPDIAAGVLHALITASYPIVACLTQPDRPQGRGLKLTPSPVKVCAQQYNIPVLQPKTLKDPIVQQQLNELKPDLMIVLAYGLLLPTKVLEIPTLGCINIHASILPRWRGAAPIQYSILNGDTESGITIMQMDAGLDTGDILATYKCPVMPTDTSADLYARLAALAQTSCIDALNKLTNHELIPQKQDSKFATYAHKIDKQDAKINWSEDSISIVRKILGYNPWPVAFTTLQDQQVRIWNAEITDLKNPNNTAPGGILGTDKNGVLVATGDGVIRLLTMQFPGKKALPAPIICNTNSALNIGYFFGDTQKTMSKR